MRMEEALRKKETEEVEKKKKRAAAEVLCSWCGSMAQAASGLASSAFLQSMTLNLTWSAFMVRDVSDRQCKSNVQES